jgi:acetyl esterase
VRPPWKAAAAALRLTDDNRRNVTDPSNLKGVAPAFLVTAEYDPLRDEGNEYAVKLKAAHVTVDHRELLGMIHGLFSFAGVVDAGKLLIDETGLALRKVFK